MHILKKLVLSLVLLAAVSVGGMTACAAETPVIAADAVTVGAGETVDVAIRVRNNPGIASMKLTVSFDEALTLNAVTYNSSLGGMTMQPQQLTSPVILNWFSGAADVQGDLVFATLSFTVAEDAADGSYPITLTYDADDLYNMMEENVAFAIENGSVTVGNGQNPGSTQGAAPTQQADPDNVSVGDGFSITPVILLLASLFCTVIFLSGMGKWQRCSE